MDGPRRQVASKVLADITAIAIKYDRNGVDVKFLNDPFEGSDLDTAQKVMDLFRRVEPTGGTLTADRLDEVMDDCMYEFKVGIQFVQIGSDPAATEFLVFLDNKLKSEHDLDRDVSTRCAQR